MERFLVDKDSYDRLNKEIVDLEERIKKLNLSKSSVHKAGTDVAWDSAEFKIIEEEIATLRCSLNQSRQKLAFCVIVEESSNENIVNLGDVVKLNIIDEYGNDEIIGKLVGIYKHNDSARYGEISVNSMLGSLIFGRTIGEKISYEVNNVPCSVEIKAKLGYVKKDDKSKTLTKVKK